MHFYLYHCLITRPSGIVSGHLVASSNDHAALVIDRHDRALGLTHQSIILRRVDDTLPDELRDGLDRLLEQGPAGFASHCDLGWVAHVAPVKRLRLFRSEDHRGMEILAVAPNEDVANALFANTLLPETQRRHAFHTTDVTETYEDEQRPGLLALLDGYQIGIADFDEEGERWFVW